MITYTALNNKDIDEKVDKEVRYCIEGIVNEFGSNVVSIVLVGGFGRGEGSVINNDGNLVPYNDYDFVVFVRKKIEKIEKERLIEKMLPMLSVSMVDIIDIVYNNVVELPFTQFNYDLKYGGIVMWGKEDIIEKIPDYKPEELSYREIHKLLRNRMVTLLEAYPGGSENEVLSGILRDRSIRQTAKVGLAIVDAYLYFNNIYKVKYQDKVNALQDLDAPNQLVELANTSLVVKVNSDLKGINAKAYWESMREMFLEITAEFTERYLTERYTYIEKSFIPLTLKTRLKMFFSYNDQLVVKYRIEKAEYLLICYYSRMNAKAISELNELLQPIKDSKENNYAGIGLHMFVELKKEVIRLWYQLLH